MAPCIYRDCAVQYNTRINSAVQKPSPIVTHSMIDATSKRSGLLLSVRHCDREFGSVSGVSLRSPMELTIRPGIDSGHGAPQERGGEVMKPSVPIVRFTDGPLKTPRYFGHAAQHVVIRMWPLLLHAVPWVHDVRHLDFWSTVPPLPLQAKHPNVKGVLETIISDQSLSDSGYHHRLTLIVHNGSYASKATSLMIHQVGRKHPRDRAPPSCLQVS